MAARRWWSITATRLQASSTWGLSTSSGRLVSTTTRRAPGCIFKKASPPEMKVSAYSGMDRTRASRASEALCSRSMTIWACLPRFRAAQQMPTAAPTASMSA